MKYFLIYLISHQYEIYSLYIPILFENIFICIAKDQYLFDSYPRKKNKRKEKKKKKEFEVNKLFFMLIQIYFIYFNSIIYIK